MGQAPPVQQSAGGAADARGTVATREQYVPRRRRCSATEELLSRDPLALVVGTLLDQHMRQRSSAAVVRTRQREGSAFRGRGIG